MDTLTEHLGAIMKADAQMVQECAALVAESAGRLYQAQLDTADRACSQATRQYRDLISSGEPAALLRTWPTAVEANMRSASETTRAYLENAVELQSGLIRIFRNHLPALNRRFFESVGEATRVAGAVGAVGRPARHDYEDEAAPARQPA